MVTDLGEIRRLAQSKEAENREFRRYLALHHYRFEAFQAIASEVQEQIDCTTCANCCRYTVVAVRQAEIEAIARYLGAEIENVIRLHTCPDPVVSGARVLASTDGGCTFLDRNLCMIYEARPSACRDFPHLATRSRSLGGRLSSLCRNAWFCPIIYNALEDYKKLVGFRSREFTLPGNGLRTS